MYLRIMPDAYQSERFKKESLWKDYKPPHETICEQVARKIQEWLKPKGESKEELTGEMAQKTLDLFK